MIDHSLQMHPVLCDLCGTKENTRFLLPCMVPEELPEAPWVVRCNHCGMLYTDPRPDIPGMTRLYQRYYDSSNGSVNRVLKKAKSYGWLRRLWHVYCGQYLTEMLGKATGRVLDVGCGTGGLLDELRQAGCDVHGIELNPDSVKTCIDKGLDVQCGALLNLEVPENSFDTVVLWHALEHLISARKALEKIMRILKPGGRVFIYSPNANSYVARYFRENWWAWHVPFHFYHFTPATICRLAGDLGFTMVKCGSKTPEYYIHKSIESLLNSKKRGCVFRLLPKAFYRWVGFRLMVAPVCRVLDLVMPKSGECLTVELQKPDRLPCGA